MSQPDFELLEPQETIDDWGDFGAVIDQLEQQETEDQPKPEEEQPAEQNNSEALEGLLNVVFTITEQATSIITGVDFEFDAKGKQQVIEAAEPVFTKHGGRLMGVFGNYIEEATLALALLALMYTAQKELKKQRVMALQQKRLEQERQERERRAHYGKETEAAQAA